jgi:hypothetical protein
LVGKPGHTSAVNSSDNSVNIKLGACIITNPTIPKTISARKAHARFLALQFSGSREDLEGIGRFRIRPLEVMRKTLPERLEEACLDKVVAVIVFPDFSTQKMVGKKGEFIRWFYTTLATTGYF